MNEPQDQYTSVCSERFSEILNELRSQRDYQASKDRELWQAIHEQGKTVQQIATKVFNGLSERSLQTAEAVAKIQESIEIDKKEREMRQRETDKERRIARRWTVGTVVTATGILAGTIVGLL